MQGPDVLAIDAMDVFGVLYPVALLVVVAALVIGIRSSGARRTKERVGEAETMILINGQPKAPSAM